MGPMKRSAMAVVAVLVVAVVSVGPSSAALYVVGDKTGWTIMGNPNYTAWADDKKFHVGDIVVFTYNKQFHNVMAVSKADFKNCDTTKPTATWSTGNDSVVLNTTGHHYFICGFTGHCAGGQKVDVRVAARSPSAAPSESPSTAPAPSPSSGSEPAGGSSSGASAAPSPHGNAASDVGRSVGMALAMSVLAVVAAGLKLL